ncbi:sodium:calcium antiporter [Aquimarina sp. AD1]|uniref:calcium/sodium antiporter n=1 Tax=Aquimarina sp. (strain AD1) TaxID=1714848 RepID=UPI000E52BF3B|nr:calcium/sodium antiporter [Aquimarina sp. AD1]AXT56326.1 sodium:calcium antiporter [Aquimarina sp. AD1]RKN18278.1 sodium:calcium antiporter [Aquimarina sp. AD1]
MIQSVLFVIIGFVLLVVGGEYLVRSSVALSFRLKLSKMVIGLTVVSFATSAPELLVSLQAALGGSADLSLSNVIGSNVANIGLVLGITALIGPLAIDKDFYKFNWPVMMLLSLVLYFFLDNDGVLTRVEGGVLLGSLFVYMFLLIGRARKHADKTVEDVDDSLEKISNFKMILWLLIGGVALYFGSELLVEGAKDIATRMGVSEAVIGLTMVAIGTSVPELAASVIAALKQEKAISLGNLIGSNIFNIASVLGVTSLIQPIAVTDTRLMNIDIFWMLGFAMILLPLAFIPKKMVLGRPKGFLIFSCYCVFIALVFFK